MNKSINICLKYYSYLLCVRIVLIGMEDRIFINVILMGKMGVSVLKKSPGINYLFI